MLKSKILISAQIHILLSENGLFRESIHLTGERHTIRTAEVEEAAFNAVENESGTSERKM